MIILCHNTQERAIRGQSAPPGGPQSGQPGAHGHQTPRARHEEGAHIHRREGAGGQAQGRAGLYEGQDLEARGQESGCRDAGVAPKPRF
jgi:hypothetical protein